MSNEPFDQLAAVLFADDFSVHRAVLVPIAIVKARARPSSHTNSHVFHLPDEVWSLPAVVDVTDKLRAASAAI